jgi:hypothetical protein
MFTKHNPVRPQMRQFGSRGFSTSNIKDTTEVPEGGKSKGKFFEFI